VNLILVPNGPTKSQFYSKTYLDFIEFLKQNIFVRLYLCVCVCVYECKTWPLTLREQRLRVFEKRAEKTPPPNREEVTGGCNVHKGKLFNLYPSPNIIRLNKSRRIRYVRHVARMGEMRNAYKILVGKPETTWKTDA